MDSGNGFTIGEQAPDFELPDTEGSIHALAGESAPATVVVFTCNHCPYALAWQDRIVSAVKDYSVKGVRFYAINCNDASRYPNDSYEQMQERVQEEDWPLPYLHDESQEVARSWGAKTTPDVYVLDSELKLAYRGAPDSDYEKPEENAKWLRDALDAVIAGREPEPAETEPVGCSIKWKL